MSITGIESTINATGKAAASQSKLAENFDTFLVMLTTQLKHQDPLSPMDSTEFTNQLVQFANVEQQIAANSNLETLIGVNALSQKAWSISYIGQTIEAAGNQLSLQGAKETATNVLDYTSGTANFSYTLPAAADSVEIQIKDASGNVVRSFTGKTTAGRHEVQWEGTDNAGNQVDTGRYTIQVNAKDTTGNDMTASTGVYTTPGSAAFSYTLATDAAVATIVIKDASGKIIRTLPAQGSAGRHEAEWDGRDKNGRMMQDGRYQLEIVANDSKGNPVEYATTVYGRVTDVASDDNDTLLNMSGVVTTLQNVLTVRDPNSITSVR